MGHFVLTCLLKLLLQSLNFILVHTHTSEKHRTAASTLSKYQTEKQIYFSNVIPVFFIFQKFYEPLENNALQGSSFSIAALHH